MTELERKALLGDQEALQEFWDNILHPSLKPEISEEAKTVAMKALEKQIPKKPKVIDQKTFSCSLLDFTCPLCNTRIISKLDDDFLAGEKEKYCLNCGQAIDWEGLE